MTLKSRAKTNVMRSCHASAVLHATQVPHSTDMTKLISHVHFCSPLPILRCVRMQHSGRADDVRHKAISKTALTYLHDGISARNVSVIDKLQKQIVELQFLLT